MMKMSFIKRFFKILIPLFSIISIFATNLIIYTARYFFLKNLWEMKKKGAKPTFSLMSAITHFDIQTPLKYLYIIVPGAIIYLIYKASKKGLNKGQLGNARFITIKELKEQYLQISEKEEEFNHQPGWIISRYKNKIFIDTAPAHSLLVGTTRSGKDETIIIPQIDIISRSNEKAGFVIIDPKGDTFTSSYETLKKRGYNIEILNLLNPLKSSFYNPLKSILDYYKKGDIPSAISMLNTISHILFKSNNNNSGKEAFFNTGAISLFNGSCLYLIEKCIENGEEDKINMFSVTTFINSICNDEEYANKLIDEFPVTSQIFLQFSTYRSSSDVTRTSINSVANSILSIFLLPDLSRLTIKNTIDFEKIGFFNNKQKIEISFINEIFNKILGKIEFEIDKNFYPDLNKNYIANVEISIKKKNILFDINCLGNKVYRKFDLVSMPKENQYLLYISTLEEITQLKNPISSNFEILSIEDFNLNYLLQLYFELEDFNISAEFNIISKNETDTDNKPTALFLIVPDFDTSKHMLVSIFIKQMYFILSKTATERAGKCDRLVYFLCNEFGSFPKIPDLSSMITVSLSRGLRFLLVLQSFAQLESIYGKDSVTIRENCSNLFYILSKDDKTIQEISKACGEITLTVPHENEKGKLSYSLSKVPLMTVDKVRNLKDGECIVLRTTKRRDLKGNKIQPLPIFNTKSTSLKFRYEYLEKDFPKGKVELDELLNKLNKFTEKIDLKDYSYL